jgi:Domain of Unknown Function with PDB structure (DUF3857)/Transglutaminase-like superfamily
MIKKWVSSLLIFFGIASIAYGQDLPFRYSDYKIAYVLNADATYEVNYSWTAKVLSQRGLESMRQASIYHSASVEKIKKITAQTIKPDGRKIEIPSGNFQVETNTGYASGKPAFSDYTRLSAIYPELAIGDSVQMNYSLNLIEPIFPGHFSVAQYFPRQTEYDNLTVTIDWPMNLTVQFDAVDMKQSLKESGLRKSIEWTYSNPKAADQEKRGYAVFDPTKIPGLAFTTFKDYEQIALAYGSRATPKAKPTQKVHEIAKQAIVGATDELAKVRALYEWVAKNISYAGNCIGVGAVVPRDQEFVIENKMGDCKDHATLLQALLSAAGIESTQVLVNAGSLFSLPKIPVVSNVNHVFTYVPSIDTYMDSTSDSTPFGMLPYGVQSKPVLHVSKYLPGTRTPTTQFGVNQQHLKMTINFKEDGSATGDMQVMLKGEYAADTRARYRGWPLSEQKKFVKEALRSMQVKGDGVISFDDPEPLLATFNYSIQFNAEALIEIGGGTIPVSPLFGSPAPIARFLYARRDEPADKETFCSNGISTEEYIFIMPKNIKISSAPKNVKISEQYLEYSASVEMIGDKLNIVRKLVDKIPGGVCSPEVVNSYEAVATKAFQTTRAQIVYQ